MFKVKKSAKQGECRALRCLAAAGEAGLCARHETEWVTAGSPDLSAPAAPEESEHQAIQTALTTERHSAQEALAMVAQIPVQTPEQREQVGLMIKAAGQRVKELDEQRKGVTGKLREAVKMIDGWFAPPKELWSQIKVGLQQRLDGELARLEAERQAAARAIAAGQAETADYVAYHTDVSAPSTVRTLSRITFAVPDSTLVPDEYWCLDYDKIDRAVKAGLLDDAPWVTVIRERVSGAK